MQKSTNSYRMKKEINFLVIISVLVLTLLTISAEAASSSSLELSPSTETGHLSEQINAEEKEEINQLILNQSVLKVSEQINSEGKGEAENSGAATLAPYGDPTLPTKTEQYMDVAYTIGGVGAAILILIGYLNITSKGPEYSKKAVKTLNPLKETEGRAISEKVDQEKLQARRFRLLTAIPILGITVAELLIFSGRIGAAVWVHIGIVIALSLSDIFLKDPEINRIYQAFMLLPVLRLINLSMPIFFETTLYTFIFVYGSLAIPVTVILLHQRDSFKQIGITMNHFVSYVFISIPLGFLLGLGEYLTIRAGYLIPDLGFENLLKLTIVMVFFVGLIEELIFRSILQSRLEKVLGVREAILITSLMFGLMHSGYGTIQEILYTGFVGFIMGVAFYKTKSLPFIAVLHGFVNVFLFGILPHQLNLLPGF